MVTIRDIREAVRGLGSRPDIERVYYPDSTEIDLETMGAIPAAVLGMPGHVRGSHPLDSFTAIGPLAHELICGQSPLDVHAPLKALAKAGGAVVMMGVGLDKMTLLHLAEQTAGRGLFRRWAYGLEQRRVEVMIGGCSSGFVNFEPLLAPLVTERSVGLSVWRVYPVRGVLEVSANAIREQPEITHCGNPWCHECNETLKSGMNPPEKESA